MMNRQTQHHQRPAGRMNPAGYTPARALAAFVLSGLLALFAGAVQASGQQIFDGPNGAVYATAQGADGTTYVGGNFTAWGPQTGRGAALDLANGAVIRTFPPVNGIVIAVASDGVGGWYIGGTFTQEAGVTRNRMAHILATGALDPVWNPDANGQVNALAVSGGMVYAGGNFTTLCTTAASSCWNGSAAQTRNRLAAIGVDSTLAGWNPGANSLVNALAISGTTVYVGGTFTTVCTTAESSCWNGSPAQTRNYVAAFGTDGALAAWNPDANGQVNALAVSGSMVYAGGNFTTLCTTAASSCWNGSAAQTRNRLAAFGMDGTLAAWNPDANSTVRALAVSGSMVYAGGEFTTVCTTAESSCWNGTAQTRNYVAAFGTDGALGTWNPGANGSVWALVVSGSTLYVGGQFTTLAGQTRNNLAAIGTDGTLTAWNPDANSMVQALAVSGSTVYAGGQFTAVGSQPRNRLAAIGADGKLTAWNPGASSQVRALAVSGTTVYVGGQFTQVCTTAASTCWNGSAAQTRNRLAAIGTDGSLAAWNPDADSTVRALAVSGSMVYAGGDFTIVGGQTRRYLAAFGADGTLTAWNPGTSAGVYALVVLGGTVYAGGIFTTVCTTAASTCWDGSAPQMRNRLAAFATDGTLNAWNPDANGLVWALVVSGSTVYVGGQFTTLAGQTRNRLAAIGTDGTLTDWNPDVGSTVNTLAVFGSTVYAGGGFSTVCADGSSCYDGSAAQTRNRLAAFGTDGTLAAWNPDASSIVYALTVPGGAVTAGGDFTSIGQGATGATGQRYFATLNTAGTPGSPTTVAATPANAGATVAWTAPGYTGTGITGYKIETAPGPNYDTWTVNVADTGSTDTSASISGLTNGANYRVRVTALASGGAGGTSIASQWFTPNLPSLIPEAPTGISATAGNGQLTLNWNPTTNWGTGASGKSYRGFVFSGGVLVKFCNVNVPATQCTITGLANGSPYTVSVRSFNSLGKFSVIPAQAGPYTPTP